MISKSNLSTSVCVCILLILFAALSRLVPHPYNFTPIGAIGLFAGTYLSVRRYWLIPVIALLVSDLFIGFYHPVVMISVYVAFILSAFIGRFMLMQNRSILKIAASSLLISCLFFIISNFGDWLSGVNQYPMNFSGLLECYFMAIPFFGNTVLGDLFYISVLFGIYESAKTWLDQMQDIPDH